MEHLLAKISKTVRAKTVLGRRISGDMFCSLLGSYVDALNSGGAPEIQSAWVRVVASQCSEARQQAEDVYDQELLTALTSRPSSTSSTSSSGQQAPDVDSSSRLEGLLPVDTHLLLESHETAKAKSKAFFRSKVNSFSFLFEVCHA